MTEAQRPEETEWAPLKKGEVRVENEGEYLWRQVHPLRVHSGVVSSEAFEPGSADDKQLSCSRSSVATQQEAHQFHTRDLGLDSAGCAQITVGDVESEKPIVEGQPDVVAARAIDDSALSSEITRLPPGHTFVDFRPFGSKRITKKAKQLAFFARRNGGLQPPKAKPEDDEPPVVLERLL